MQMHNIYTNTSSLVRYACAQPCNAEDLQEWRREMCQGRRVSSEERLDFDQTNAPEGTPSTSGGPSLSACKGGMTADSHSIRTSVAGPFGRHMVARDTDKR